MVAQAAPLKKNGDPKKKRLEVVGKNRTESHKRGGQEKKN